MRADAALTRMNVPRLADCSSKSRRIFYRVEKTAKSCDGMFTLAFPQQFLKYRRVLHVGTKPGAALIVHPANKLAGNHVAASQPRASYGA